MPPTRLGVHSNSVKIKKNEAIKKEGILVPLKETKSESRGVLYNNNSINL